MQAVAKAPAMVLGFAKPRFATFVRYAKIELVPPTPAEIPAAIGQAGKLVQSAMTFRWTKLPVREAWLNALVGIEVGCWFFIGECIGKGSLVGYQV